MPADRNGDAPLVRLRVRVLQRVRHDGHRTVLSTVFCPGHLRSLELDTCLRCPRLSSRGDDAINCAPVSGQRPVYDLSTVARIGGDACVGDAMGCFAVSVHADLAVGALVRCLEEESAAVAIVVDDLGRLVGLVDAADAARATEPVRVCALARHILPVHESAPLAHAVDRMVHERARALPVVDDERSVVALLTDLDALHWVARQSALR